MSPVHSNSHSVQNKLVVSLQSVQSSFWDWLHSVVFFQGPWLHFFQLVLIAAWSQTSQQSQQQLETIAHFSRLTFFSSSVVFLRC